MYPALARVPAELFGVCVVATERQHVRDRRRAVRVHDHERLEAVRVRTRLRGARARGSASETRRQQHRSAVQLAQRNRAEPGRQDEPDGERRRDRDDEPRAGRSTADEKWETIHAGPLAVRRPRARARRRGLSLGLGDEPPQPEHRTAPPDLRPDLLRPGRGDRRLHEAVLAERQRDRPCGDGRDSRRRRRQSAHRPTRDRRDHLPVHTRRDDDGRPLRALRRLALRHRPARARAGSAAGSSPSRPARAGSGRSRRDSTRPATASRGSSPQRSSRAASDSISSPRSRRREAPADRARRRRRARRCRRRRPPATRTRRRSPSATRRSCAWSPTPEGARPAKPYVPIDVDRLLGEPTVALRGPWGGGDLVTIGPTATELSKGLFEYHLDFPGNALDPGCGYLHWQERLFTGQTPVVYAHVATEPSFPGQARAAVLVLLRLQRLEQPA